MRLGIELLSFEGAIASIGFTVIRYGAFYKQSFFLVKILVGCLFDLLLQFGNLALLKFACPLALLLSLR